jgi:hypothetical protein
MFFVNLRTSFKVNKLATHLHVHISCKWSIIKHCTWSRLMVIHLAKQHILHVFLGLDFCWNNWCLVKEITVYYRFRLISNENVNSWLGDSFFAWNLGFGCCGGTNSGSCFISRRHSHGMIPLIEHPLSSKLMKTAIAFLYLVLGINCKCLVACRLATMST